MTAQPNVASSADVHAGDAVTGGARRIAYGYGVLLGGLLLGYMFLGRGFAHIGIGPIFIGDVVMLVGIVAAVAVIILTRRVPPLTLTLGLLLAFALLGAARTLPYVGTYGMDALRDAVLWGYAAFALIIYILVDRWSLLTSFRAYGWVVPVFALWLPICWNLFRIFSLDIDPNRPGDTVPLVFFKGGDMAVHVVGVIAFLIIGAAAVTSARTFIWRTLIFLPLLWTIFVAGTSNRGALVTAVLGVIAVALLAGRTRNWRPFLAAIGVAVAALAIQSIVVAVAMSPDPGPSAAGPSSTSSREPSATPGATGGAIASPVPVPGEPVALTNGDFELGLGDTGGPEGWTPRGAEVSLRAEGGEGGSAFVSMLNPNQPYEATLTSDPFPMEAGRDIGVSAWVTAIRGRPTLEIYVNWLDESGAFISNSLVEALATEGDESWREFGGVATAPAETTHAEIHLFEAAGRATLGIDAIAARVGDFTDEPDAPPPFVGGGPGLINGGFELGLDATGAPRGWTARAAEVTVVHESGDGAAFAEVQNPLSAYAATLTSNRFAFSGGKDIRVSAWLKAVQSRPALEIYINWYGPAGDLISSDLAVGASTEGRNTWLELSGAVRAPEGATHAEVKLFEAIGHATLGLDDVTIEVGDFGPTVQASQGSTGSPGRPATVAQLLENIMSLFSDVPDPGLEGTENFRLAWWGTIVNYTVFGDQFWTGKGFGINLADSDGFQSTGDGSLRAPHNSHLTVLARMGVPGFILWVALQVAFGVGLLRAALFNRRRGETVLAATAAWLLLYWVAMMIDTSVDPYIEGPQGGIWFWAVIGAGLVVMRLSSERSAT